MIIKLYTEDKEGNEVWVNFHVDENKVDGFWNIPTYSDEIVTVESDEYNILLGGNIMTVKDCTDLIILLQYKFKET